MPDPAFCTEHDVHALVHRFYDRVRADELLGPVFDARIQDWGPHLAKMVDFWSSALRGTARYRGMPMVVHARMPELRPAMFGRWLTLFEQTTTELGQPQLKARADMLARRIAQSLWYGHPANEETAALMAERAAQG